MRTLNLMIVIAALLISLYVGVASFLAFNRSVKEHADNSPNRWAIALARGVCMLVSTILMSVSGTIVWSVGQLCLHVIRLVI